MSLTIWKLYLIFGCTFWLHFLTHNFPLVVLYYSPSVLPEYIVPLFPIDVLLSLSNRNASASACVVLGQYIAYGGVTQYMI